MEKLRRNNIIKTKRIQPLWKCFKLWMEEYKHLFKNEPILVEETEKGVRYKFKGVSPLLSLWVDDYQCIIIIEYQGKCWGIIWAERDCPAKKQPEKGFYCELCIPKYRKFYDSLEDLYFEHSFLAVLRWCNENFTISNRLYFYKSRSCREVMIDSARNFAKQYDKSCFMVEPVVTEAFLK